MKNFDLSDIINNKPRKISVDAPSVILSPRDDKIDGKSANLGVGSGDRIGISSKRS